MWNVFIRKSSENKTVMASKRVLGEPMPWHVILSSHCRLSIPPWESRERRRAKLVLSLTSPANSRRRRRNSVSFPMPSCRSVYFPLEDIPSPPSSELPNYRCHPRGRNFAVETDTDPTGNPLRKFHVYIGTGGKEGGCEVVMVCTKNNK